MCITSVWWIFREQNGVTVLKLLKFGQHSVLAHMVRVVNCWYKSLLEIEDLETLPSMER